MRFESVIGLEVHVQLNTLSKAFCSDENVFGGAENTHTSAISLAHPGTLPRPNMTQLRSAIKLGLAIGSKICQKTFFDRKNYFYADLPKGYQITQDKTPICQGGHFVIDAENGPKKIEIHQIHMEEDAGKSIHDKDPKYSLIDLNRAGTPLLEIVTEPDLRTPEEAADFIRKVRQMVRYLGISDGDMDKGSLRCDCNISIRPMGDTTLHTRCEVKNVNSINYAKRAIEFEIKRQIGCVERGEEIIQSTLHFDPVTGETSPMRAKENAHDYRYFPDPDLPLIEVTQGVLDEIKKSIDILPEEVLQQCINRYQMTVGHAQIIAAEKSFALHFLSSAKIISNTAELVKLYINKIRPVFDTIDKTLLSPLRVKGFISLMDDNKVNKTTAYQKLFPVFIQENEDPERIAQRLDILQEASDGDEGLLLIQAVLDRHPEEVMRYRGGAKNLLGFFMGEVMKATKGKLDPKQAKVGLMRLLEVSEKN